MTTFQKATRHQVRLNLAITGPSGSGKTYGALQVATGLAAATGGRVALLDTEYRTAEYYADVFDFDKADVLAPYLLHKFVDAIAGAEAGHVVLVIDSATHLWDGDGGILARKEQKDKQGGNSYVNWREFKAEWKDFIERMRGSSIDIIATMRSKTEYVIQDNDKGKSSPVKMGMAPIAPPDADYEFDVVFDVDRSHKFVTSKDRTGIFAGITGKMLTPETGAKLAKWRDGGVEIPKTAEIPVQENEPREEIVPMDPIAEPGEIDGTKERQRYFATARELGLPKHEGEDKAKHYNFWSCKLGREITSGSQLTAEDWKVVADAMEVKKQAKAAA